VADRGQPQGASPVSYADGVERKTPWTALVIAEIVCWVVLSVYRDALPSILVGAVVATLILILVVVVVWTWRQSRRPE
jgi:hypothetical protein